MTDTKDLERWAIQTEDISPGDVIPRWDDVNDATVTSVIVRGNSVKVFTDGTPRSRTYMANRTVTVLR